MERVNELDWQHVGWWSRLARTPLRDLLRGDISGRYDLRLELAAAGLPQPLAGLVLDVVGLTRLWRREKLEVTRELISHFAEGLDAGRSPAQLVDEFGSAAQTARLVRRAVLRKRPLYWQIWWLLSRTMAAAIVALLLGYAWLSLTFYLKRPTVARNYWEEINAARSVPADERAWPLYREAGFQIESEDREFIRYDFEHGPQDADWPRLVVLLDKYPGALDLTRRAAKLPRLGYLFGDPEDAAAAKELNKPWFPSSFALADQNESLLHLNLSGLHVLQTLAKLLVLDTTRAAADGSAERVEQNLQSLLAMSEQIVQPQAMLVEQLISLQLFGATLHQVARLLDEYPDLFNDAQLRDLAHRIAAYRQGQLSISFAGEFIGFADQLQRIYTDDGEGNGSVGAEGFQALLELAPPLRYDPIDPLLGPGAAALIASREQERRFFQETIDRLVQLRSGPPWTWNYEAIDEAEDRINQEVRQASGLRHMPTGLYAPAVGAAIDASERTIQTRDAVLAAIAIVLYHRRHDAWPERLQQLVPDLLPAVPPDRFDGKPLRYLVREGQPVLYSIGDDYHDDGGRPGPEGIEVGIGPKRPAGTHPDASKGDWILWPPRTPDAEE